MLQQLLLADIGSIFAIGFLVISFIGWIINLINQQNPPPPPQGQGARRPRPRDQKVQNEIEQFLQEAMAGRREAPRAAAADADDIEIIRPATRRRRRPPQRQGGPPAASALGGAAEEPAVRRRPGDTMARRAPVGSTSLGSNVTSHVQEYLSARVADGVTLHLPHDVDRAVSQHLGEFTADDHDPRSSVRPATTVAASSSSLRQELREPAGMRKAIVLQEVLSRPRALRRRT